MATMFTTDYRERIRELLIGRAREDDRIVAAAAVGSSATGADRWSDLDLTFGVADGTDIEAALSDWTAHMIDQFDAVVLFDLPFRSIIYRVFLLPGKLQIDLSFAPGAEFGATSPRFQLIFGEAKQHPPVQPPSSQHLVGLSVHHAVRAHICIERGKLWQAEHWIHNLRDDMLTVACLRRGLAAREGRGYDALPPELLASWQESLPATIAANALRRALGAAVAGLVREGAADLNTTRWLRKELEDISRSATK